MSEEITKLPKGESTVIEETFARKPDEEVFINTDKELDVNVKERDYNEEKEHERLKIEVEAVKRTEKACIDILVAIRINLDEGDRFDSLLQTSNEGTYYFDTRHVVDRI